MTAVESLQSGDFRYWRPSDWLGALQQGCYGYPDASWQGQAKMVGGGGEVADINGPPYTYTC